MYFTRNSSSRQFLAHGSHVLTFLEGSVEAQSLLSQFGMDGTQLQRGRTLLNQLQSALQQVDEQKSRQKAATDSFYAERWQVRQIYQLHVQAARRGLGREASHFVQASPKGYLAWLTQAQAFYTALLANPAYQEKLRQLGVPSEELQRASQLLAEMVDNKDRQTSSHVGQRSASELRKQSLVEAQRWFAALTKVAKIAFYQHPALLDAIRPLPSPTTATQEDEPSPKATSKIVTIVVNPTQPTDLTSELR